MTILRRYWFPLSVLLLLAVIAMNLYALNGRRAAEEIKNSKSAERHARTGTPETDSPAKKEHGHDNPANEPSKHDEKKEPIDHGMVDHKGMMGKGLMDQKGMMGKGMMGMMHGNMADMLDIRFLLFNHEKIKRTVKRLPDGVETETTSTDDAVAGKIEAHVKAMYERLKKKQVIRPMDPLFAALFENADKIELEMTKLPSGLRVKETSKDAYTVKLIHAHADAVDRFVKDGMSAMMKMTPVPKREVHAIAVQWSGELKNVMMKGDLRGTIDIATIGKLPHMYAVGALEDLQGEVTIIDSVATIVTVRDGKQVVTQMAQGKACVLVYAQVKQWKSTLAPSSIKSLADLETFLVETGKKEGINVERPFPFLIEAKVRNAKYHVLRHPGDVKESRDFHDKAQVPFTYTNGAVELVGFYSDKHLGIFTCQSNLHVHLRSADGAVSGHLDDVELDSGAVLFLPTR